MTRYLKWCSSLSIINWPEEIVFYHQQSGDTHLFSGFPAKVIKYCLSKETFSPSELMDEIQGFFEEGQNSVDDIELIVTNLLRKNLIVSS